MSEISNPDTESELYPDVMTDENLCYVNGRVACRTYASDIVQFLVADVKKEMETLHILSVGYEIFKRNKKCRDLPVSCRKSAIRAAGNDIAVSYRLDCIYDELSGKTTVFCKPDGGGRNL